ncbi:uncharacterized protein LOC116922508 isoform X2 [Daphnia magna]|uniref:Uncharacterized protein n=2 Tax=Daphnia magna TaxID=35525 RepID=A0A164RQ96_9CRUS|nr:uncharacterized protein LOC116922508 isoform X2 [Daphnia magna]KAK4005768.1 hypothetical protein OUZ56_010846 [Daphnia magna]KZS08850.1 Uncharacterized protein APZ42_027057 [Daphnia magna]
MPSTRHNPDPCAQFRMLGHPCSSQHPQLLPSVYQAALNHAGPYGHARAISHTPWEAVTFVAIVLVAYIAVLGYLATRALRQVPRGTSGGSLPGGLLDTRIVYNAKTDSCQPPMPAELTDTPDGSFDV